MKESSEYLYNDKFEIHNGYLTILHIQAKNNTMFIQDGLITSSENLHLHKTNKKMAIILIINTFRTLEINQRLATVIKNWYGIAIRIDIAKEIDLRI